MTPRTTLILGCVVGLAIGGCNLFERKPEVTAAPDEPEKRVRDAGAGSAEAPDDAAPTVFIGVLSAANSVDIAPRVAGIVSKVHVGAGDLVTEGQPIADMDPAQMREELRAAEAALGAAGAAVRQASVDLEDARRKLAVEQRGLEQGISPAQNVEEAKLGVKRAQASVERARSTQAAEAARAQTARDHVKDTTLRAPFAGTVATKYRDAGNRIEAGQPIVKIVGHGNMRLRFAVPPQLTRITQVGTRVTTTIDTVPDPITAIVKQVSPTLDPASGMIIVEAELVAETDDAAKALRPGLAAWVRP